jgi:hypothetical protein
VTAFDELQRSLMIVRTPVGDGWILTSDEPTFRAPATTAAPARLLPSGDAWFLLHGADRELLVPDAAKRGMLWTSRVWPGAILVEGEIAGVWRRAGATISLQPWQGLSPAQRDAVEAEAMSLPLPGIDGPISVRWDE